MKRVIASCSAKASRLGRKSRRQLNPPAGWNFICWNRKAAGFRNLKRRSVVLMRGKHSGEKPDQYLRRRINPALNRRPPFCGGGTHKVPVRLHGKGNVGAKPKAEAVAEILAAIKERRA